MPFTINMDKSQFANDNKFVSEIQLADTGYGQGKVFSKIHYIWHQCILLLPMKEI